MYKLETVCFSVENILIQDGNTAEYQTQVRTQFTLHAHTDNPLVLSTNKEIFIKHISDNIYAIQGYIYESECDYALININGIKLSICNKNMEYKYGTIYEGIVSLSYDIWNCYDMNVCEYNYDEDLCFEGITKNIQLITTNETNNIALDKTSSWEDKNMYPHSTSSYFITVKLCENRILQKDDNPLQVSHQRLTLELDGIPKNKIQKIESYIKKICRLDK